MQMEYWILRLVSGLRNEPSYLAAWRTPSLPALRGWAGIGISSSRCPNLLMWYLSLDGLMMQFTICSIMFILCTVILYNMEYKLAYNKLIICLLYCSLSLVEAFSFRALVKDNHFNYYPFVYAVQKIIIIVIWLFITLGQNIISLRRLAMVLPLSASICASTILSAHCLDRTSQVTVVSFKKLGVAFNLMLSWCVRPHLRVSVWQDLAVGAVVVGGLLAGGRTVWEGNPQDYVQCVVLGLNWAIALWLSAYLGRSHAFSALELQFYHAILSLPFFLGIINIQSQAEDIIIYFKFHFEPSFTLVIFLVISSAAFSEYLCNRIAICIQPLQAATASSLSDLLLLFFSFLYFKDLLPTLLSIIGFCACLIASILLSLSMLGQQGRNPIRKIEGEVEAGREDLQLHSKREEMKEEVQI